MKLESNKQIRPQVEKLMDAGITVMAHIGFTPQAGHLLGGYRIQRRGEPNG